jgi:superfamily II DNA or RNA helicase
MKIEIPSVVSEVVFKSNKIIKLLTKPETIDAEVSLIRSSTNNAKTFRFKGHDVLVLTIRNPSLSKKYEYVLLRDSDSELTNGEDYFSTHIWIKHPLLKESYLKKHNPDYVRGSWEDVFRYKKDRVDDPGLRSPQIGALHALEAHWCVSEKEAVVVLPTGTGKTETMLSAMITNKVDKLLVVVPGDALREQISKKFSTLGILPKFGIVSEECESPIVGVMKHGFTTAIDIDEYFDSVNVVIATMQVLVACKSEFRYHIGQKVSHLFIDEAHHTPAETWKKFKTQLSHCRIVMFTATPFRNDGKKLDGRIIFNFPLRLAQEQGYFKPIRFLPISEYDRTLADEKIAELAVTTLLKDLNEGFDHILMVRVNSIDRAENIINYYQKHSELNAVIVHSQIKPESKLKELVRAVVAKKHRIVICVDMLGEGFDLPELKIAAFHDTKKSLAITLQLAGRFTRVRSDLGDAKFIANVAEPEVTEDLENLYFRDSDWNKLLPDLAFNMNLEQEDFRSFLEGFRGFPDNFPIQSIKHPLSTIIYKTKEKSWKPALYKHGLNKEESFEYLYSDYNQPEEVLVIIVGLKSYVKWARVEDFTSVNFDVIICHFDRDSQLLFIHASNTNSYYEKLAHAILPESVLLKGEEMFRVFSGVNRLRLHNLGLREPMGRARNFIMRVGSDIGTTLRQIDIKKATKSNIFGAGFVNGQRYNIGCSANGRIWSMRSNHIPIWIKWCKKVAAKVIDQAIDPSEVLRGTLIPTERLTFPDSVLFSIEWPDFIYRELIASADIAFPNKEVYPLWDCDLVPVSQSKQEVHFNLETPGGNYLIKLILFANGDDLSYRFETSKSISIDGADVSNFAEFLYKHPPMMYFTDGSFMEGNLYTEITQLNPRFSVENIISLDWSKTNIRRESQTYLKDRESIQYAVIQMLRGDQTYDIIIDDDDKGEVADIVGFRVDKPNKTLNVDLFHCKFSIDGTVGSRIDNFYAVCSQAQKSIKWMENTDLMFRQLLRRSDKRLKIKNVDRFEVGDLDSLDILRRRSKKELKMKMNIFIVQPGFSVRKYDEKGDISSLLAALESYLKETWDAPLKVYGNIQ